MQITDLDWRQIFNDWPDADLLYLRCIIDEKLRQRPIRKTMIRRDD
jgi:hypothetical protein